MLLNVRLEDDSAGHPSHAHSAENLLEHGERVTSHRRPSSSCMALHRQDSDGRDEQETPGI